MLNVKFNVDTTIDDMERAIAYLIDSGLEIENLTITEND